MSRSSSSIAKPLRILITSGDPDGIGLEVTYKALNALGPWPGVQFFIFRKPFERQGIRRFQSKKVRFLTVQDLTKASRMPFDFRTVVEIHSHQEPAAWVEKAARACLRNEFQALVTAPLSKTSIISSGLKDIGHTEILARVSGKNDLFMGFVGGRFSIVLATGHIPLREVASRLKRSTLESALFAARRLRQILPPPKRKLPIALVGLNPHAGEDGIIGTEEAEFTHVLHSDVKGPLVPDAAFLPENWRKFSVYVCPYHDQGLIPFKMVHGFDQGVHLTLGLPFVRTSVDHGTAKELFGKNKARSGSMRDAILMAVRLAQEGLG